MFVMVSLHVLAFFWVRRRLDLLFMLACGVVRCFSLSIGDFILGTVPSVKEACKYTKTPDNPLRSSGI